MVAKTTYEKKTSPEQGSGKVKTGIKATTGAWWKSTVQEVKGKATDAPTENVSPDTKSKKDQPQKRRSTKSKKTGGKKTAQTEEKKISQLEPEQVSAGEEPKTGKRPSRKRGGKREKNAPSAGAKALQADSKPQELDQVAQKNFDEPKRMSGQDSLEKMGPGTVDDSQQKTAVETTDEGTKPPDLEPVSSDPASAQAQEKKRGRPRRGKRGSKKPAEIKTSPDLAQEGESQEPEVDVDKAGQQEKEGETNAVRKLLINADEPEECRLALLEEGRLECIYVSAITRTHTRNNIYKARIVALEANLQAAFVDYGTEKNGFLPFGEIHPEYYRQNVSEKTRKLIDQHQWKKLSITEVLEKGQEVLVQVVKEEIGTKGANMTTYLSLPGRCVVLLPGSDSSGISRKISGEERRSKLRAIMESMTIPEGIGWIVRTASNDINKTALSRDVNYLLRLWTEIKQKGQDMDGVGMIYQDHDSVLRFLREHFDPSIEEILVDNQSALDQVKGFIEILPPKQRTVKVKLHRGSRPIFNQYSIEDQIESIYQPRVGLPSGGSIVIDQTEALVAIDVNSGSTSKDHNFEASIFQANMEAATELARQLRLRDLGGLIVVDFIDMRSQKNIREVEKRVKTAMKKDKAKVDISRISKFGLMQISRQKLGAPIDAGTYRVCEHCMGRGTVRSVETLALFYLRRIQTGASRKQVQQVECHFPLEVAQYLLNNKRQELIELEKRYNTEISIIARSSFKPADNEIIYHKTEKEGAGKKQA